MIYDFLKDSVLGLFVQGFCVSLVRPGVVIFLVLVLVKGWGRGIGLPILFWRPRERKPGTPPRTTRPAPVQQLLVGIGVGALTWQVLLAGYLFEEFATNYTLDRPPFCEARAGEEGIREYHTSVPAMDAWGVSGYTLKFPAVGKDFRGRFRYDPLALTSMWQYAASVVAGGLVIVALAVLGSLLLRAVSWLSLRTRPQHRPAPPARQSLPRSVWLPAGMALGAVALSGVTAGWFEFKPGGCRPAQWTGQVLTTVADWGTQSGRQAVVEWKEGGKLKDEPDPEAVAAEAKARYAPYYPVYGAFVLNFVLIVTASFVLMWLPARLRLFSPAVGIVLLLNLLIFLSTMLNYFSPLPGEFVSILLIGLAVYSGRAYKLKFPNLDDYYSAPVPLEQFYQRRAAIEAAETVAAAAAGQLLGTPPPPVLQTSPSPKIESPPAVGPPTSLVSSESIPFGYSQPAPKQTGTDATAAPEARRPKLAIICASGGGSRAAAWTMKTLLHIEQAFAAPPGKKHPPVPFPYNVRLVTGASGGMIAASYYVASLATPDPKSPAVVQRNQFNGKQLTPDQLFDGVCEDFLTPVIHTLVSRDLPSLFAAKHLGRRDRGVKMEEVWETALHGQLAKTFEDMRVGEEEGWRPSLIFSPMMIEDGRQLFISNLDLARVVRNSATILGETDPPADTSPLNPFDAAGRRLLSREGMEFFKVFPKADKFCLATAARMSASFPYILPAAYLPTNPPRRVVDAGYYDNYGVGIAASWLFNHFEWVKKHTSGVVVIQVRDGVSGPSRRREVVTDAFPSTPAAGLHFLTSPPAGLWSFRQAAHAFRNDNLLHLLGDFFAARGFPRDFLATVSFEFPAGDDVALNFTLTEGECASICAAAETTEFRAQTAALLDWWHN